MIEDTLGALKDYADTPILIFYSVLLLILTYLINVGGVTITKIGTAAQRTTVAIASNVFIWLFFLLVPINGDYIEKFKVLQLVGFLTLFFGVCLYNEIVVLKFWGFNRNTHKAISDRE